jgi:hypothetical protein
MASLYDTEIKDLPLLWTVDEAVGKHCRNAVLDVYLVQFFLTKIIYSKPEINRSNFVYPKTSVPAERWEVNGSWQDSMHRGIEAFQLFLYNASTIKESGLPLLVNGRVDPIRGAKPALKFQGELNSTMVYLNRCMRLQHQQLFDNILTSHDVPSYLHFALLKIAVEHQKRARAGN